MSAASKTLEPVVEVGPVPVSEPKAARPNTYGQILKSSALIGGSSALIIALGIVRTKAMALLLGPSGVGLLGIYGSIADLARTVAGMGINTSGVRQIAEAAGTGDDERISRTVTTLRRVALALGALGALLLVVFCVPVSRLSFRPEDGQRPASTALLSLAVFFGAVCAGQIALVQGMRRIGDLARANAFGALYGTVSGIAIIYFWRAAGVVPSLVCVAATAMVAAWWYSRRIQVRQVAMRLGDMSGEVSALLKLGFVFMASGLMMVGVAYLVRIIVVRTMGVEAAGYYQSAWALGGLYVGFILTAMGADFFPRLTAAAHDNHECNRLVNEQTEVSLLLAGPGILGTLTFAPLVIHLFYSAKFEPAVEILRWICLGMALRVASWPMGYILLAKGARQPFFWSEVASSLAQVGLVWVGVRVFKLAGTGIAFFGGYVFYWLLIYSVVRAMSGFRWSTANKKVGLLYAGLIAVVFVAWYLGPPYRHWLPRWAFVSGATLITSAASLYSLKTLCTLVPLERLPRLAQRAIVFFRLAPPPGRL